MITILDTFKETIGDGVKTGVEVLSKTLKEGEIPSPYGTEDGHIEIFIQDFGLNGYVEDPPAVFRLKIRIERTDETGANRLPIIQPVAKIKGEPAVCPFEKDMSPVFKRDKPTWDLRGEDRCCSFCGSWHPEEFLKFIDQVIEDPDINIRVEMNDRRDKVYIHRPNIANAGAGAIKFKLAHLNSFIQEDSALKDNIPEIEAKINQAFRISAEKFHDVMGKLDLK